MAGTQRKTRAVVFDLDDTLYPERQYVRSGYGAVARELRRRLGREERFEEWLWQRFCTGRGDRALDALVEQFGLGLSDEQIGELVQVYRTHGPDIRPYPGVIELLERLREHFRLGLLSDGFLPAQRLKLEALGIERHFHAVVFTESIGRDAWKPSPAGFELARDKLRVAHEACAYVSDNAAKDFIAPNALGWLTVQIRWPGQVHAARPAPPGGEPQTVVDSLDRLERTII